MRYSKLLLTGLVAAFILALGAGVSSASRGLEASVASGELGRIAADSRSLTFTDEESTVSIICELRTTITLHRTVAKAAGSLAGFVTAATPANCRGGRVRILNLPWHITFVSFSGTLPAITSVRLQLNGASFLIEAFFGIAECLYRGNPQGTTVGGTTVTSITADERIRTPLFDERLSSVACPRNGIFRGSLTVTPNVRLRLI